MSITNKGGFNAPLGSYGQAVGSYGQAVQNQLAQHRPSKELIDEQLRGLPGMEHLDAPPVPLMRTKEEILAQLQARYDELEKQANEPLRRYPCDTCIWLHNSRQCKHPLIKGLESTPPWNYECDTVGIAKLCGPEKALWEEQPLMQSWWERMWEFILRPFIL